MFNPLRSTNAAKRRVGLPAVVALAALAVSAPAMATPIPTTAGPAPTTTVGLPGATTQGIIMRDGGVCDPIRHMGC
ncbi:hypothetical protein OM076_11280 [Solirubrobacter ginsenosidimutans]|uniref:Uncharacterized protein n=1 Tax=Solirubrobacter ginsenosidimutans TaxID=490573 RepID=A0A9X3MTA5_9ACTN|nr:hypothetical protein [Solirubrobacter ginsenosidimutans]MDA0160848.1 hypothetical protein [Solirubrobacter ginsenosidimutans]